MYRRLGIRRIEPRMNGRYLEDDEIETSKKIYYEVVDYGFVLENLEMKILTRLMKFYFKRIYPISADRRHYLCSHRRWMREQWYREVF